MNRPSPRNLNEEERLIVAHLRAAVALFEASERDARYRWRRGWFREAVSQAEAIIYARARMRDIMRT